MGVNSLLGVALHMTEGDIMSARKYSCFKKYINFSKRYTDFRHKP
ncbi:hypothetical protein [Piscirickettsia salmonis]|nr:hypothetical protein [Piscirickettsia salmonis]